MPDNVFGGRAYKSGRNQQSLSSQQPAYLIKQEKDSAHIVKAHSMLSAVKGDKAGASEDEITAADKETKASKRGGKKSMDERSATDSSSALTEAGSLSMCSTVADI